MELMHQFSPIEWFDTVISVEITGIPFAQIVLGKKPAQQLSGFYKSLTSGIADKHVEV